MILIKTCIIDHIWSSKIHRKKFCKSDDHMITKPTWSWVYVFFKIIWSSTQQDPILYKIPSKLFHLKAVLALTLELFWLIKAKTASKWYFLRGEYGNLFFNVCFIFLQIRNENITPLLIINFFGYVGFIFWFSYAQTLWPKQNKKERNLTSL